MSIPSESTLSLTTKISKISQSLDEYTNPDRYQDNPLQPIFQFLTAKIYENRELLGKGAASASLAKKQSESFFGFHDQISIAPTDFYPRGDAEREFLLVSNNGDRVTATAGTYVVNATVPLGRSASTIAIFGSQTKNKNNTFLVYSNSFVNTSSTTLMSKVGIVGDGQLSLTTNFEASKSNYLSIAVTLVDGSEIYGAKIGIL